MLHAKKEPHNLLVTVIELSSDVHDASGPDTIDQVPNLRNSMHFHIPAHPLN